MALPAPVVAVAWRQRRRLVTAGAVVAMALGGLLVLPIIMVVGSGAAPTVPLAGVDIPAVVLAAYQQAALTADSFPGCVVRWTVVAGVGQVESHHGRSGGASAAPNGDVVPHIVGPTLDGSGGTQAIPDTDHGHYDGDSVWDHAVGPMQFIPSTWATLARDANGDGTADPHNIFDAAAGAVALLCTQARGDFGDDAALGRALRAYNNSDDYVRTVLGWIHFYDSAATATAVGAGGPYVLPVPPELVTLAQLTRPHHHYPAADIPVSDDTPVFAATWGSVLTVTSDETCGNGVIMLGGDGFTYTYCHGLQVFVAAGQTVAAGQQIMASGHSGHVIPAGPDGAHLHLAMADAGGAAVCPQPYLVEWYEGRASSPADVSLRQADCVSSSGGLA